jgi:hypothetical protein
MITLDISMEMSSKVRSRVANLDLPVGVVYPGCAAAIA